ncbi:23S rRNA (uracil(747)-C(5))-methyltransferase RlmC [Georgenia sp. H159]|uniref:23S rRNA (uracil(747)-C(5))-methyltransferase RlmC n=1 Tax=Georgenia sp. H159 TaxID=3076115 RepID=UPI002D76A34F|nr:23S rRNA (uracil(747)-C(5))-methyltransferase RlmC [Georgenia sp. H159]
MHCSYFDAGRCGSCTLMGRPYEEQLAGKQEHVRTLLAAHEQLSWLPPVASLESGYRNKAKMAVGGSVESPTLGILDAGGHGTDLRHCGIIAPGIRATFSALTTFIATAGLVPYDVPARRGELKHLIVTESPDGRLMVRFVLRSREAVPRVRKHLPTLRAALPQLRVVSVNLLPEHKAVVEGEEELLLTEQETLTMRLNGIDLHLRPQGFFQTNTDVAATLYARASSWADDVAPRSVWDLYCGVGGFALHCAAPGRDVVGIETSAAAVAAGERSRREAGLANVRFIADDATAFALAADRWPDLVIVNPPRRGIGPRLAQWLEHSSVRNVLYSSCNAASLARDLAAMPSLVPVRGQVLDMFPQTSHAEVLVQLERRGYVAA